MKKDKKYSVAKLLERFARREPTAAEQFKSALPRGRRSFTLLELLEVQFNFVDKCWLCVSLLPSDLALEFAFDVVEQAYDSAVCRKAAAAFRTKTKVAEARKALRREVNCSDPKSLCHFFFDWVDVLLSTELPRIANVASVWAQPEHLYLLMLYVVIAEDRERTV